MHPSPSSKSDPELSSASPEQSLIADPALQTHPTLHKIKSDTHPCITIPRNRPAALHGRTATTGSVRC